MKKIINLFFVFLSVFSFVFLTSCSVNDYKKPLGELGDLFNDNLIVDGKEFEVGSVINFPKKIMVKKANATSSMFSLKVNVKPSNATDKSVYFTANFEDGSECYEYIKIESVDLFDDPIVDVSILKPFNQTIILTAISVMNPNAKATCEIDFCNRVDEINMNLSDICLINGMFDYSLEFNPNIVLNHDTHNESYVLFNNRVDYIEKINLYNNLGGIYEIGNLIDYDVDLNDNFILNGSIGGISYDVNVYFTTDIISWLGNNGYSTEWSYLDELDVFRLNDMFYYLQNEDESTFIEDQYFINFFNSLDYQFLVEINCYSMYDGEVIDLNKFNIYLGGFSYYINVDELSFDNSNIVG